MIRVAMFDEPHIEIAAVLSGDKEGLVVLLPIDASMFDVTSIQQTIGFQLRAGVCASRVPPEVRFSVTRYKNGYRGRLQ